MKRILLLIFTTTLFFNLNAQIQQGSIITGGHFNYNNTDHSTDNSSFSNGHNYSSNSLTISPRIGFFTSESTLVGIGLVFEHRDSESESSGYYGTSIDKFKSNLFLINPYVTKYSKIKDKFYFTTRVNLMAGIGKEDDNKVFELRVNATPGLSYFVNDKWALTCSVGNIYYNYKEVKLEDDSNNKVKDKQYGTNLDFNTFTLGFQYVINKRSRE